MDDKLQGVRVRAVRRGERRGRRKPHSANFKPGQSGNPRGRPKGSKNKRTRPSELERLAIEAMTSGNARKAMGQKLAREVLAEAMMALWAKAEERRDDPAREAEWRSYMMAAVEVAAKLAPNESPRLEAVTVQQADPFDHLTDQELYDDLCQRARELGMPAPRNPLLIETRPLKKRFGDVH